MPSTDEAPGKPWRAGKAETAGIDSVAGPLVFFVSGAAGLRSRSQPDDGGPASPAGDGAAW